MKSGGTELAEWRSCCPISSALDVLGDKWSLLIIRDLIVHGTRTFSQFLNAPEHISTNILTSRLKLLSRLKLIERTGPNASARTTHSPSPSAAPRCDPSSRASPTGPTPTSRNSTTACRASARECRSLRTVRHGSDSVSTVRRLTRRPRPSCAVRCNYSRRRAATQRRCCARTLRVAANTVMSGAALPLLPSVSNCA